MQCVIAITIIANTINFIFSNSLHRIADELAHLKSKQESKLNQLTADELNEIRLSIISRIGDFSKVLNKFKLNKLNSSINVDQVPSGVLSIGKTIKKWPISSNDSLNILLTDLKIGYLDRIILEDTVIDKQSSTVNILMKLKKIQFKGKFSICLKNETANCLNGDFEQLANETLINWSAKLTLHDQLKFSLEDANLKNHINFNKILTKTQLKDVKVLNNLVDQVIAEFVKVHLNKEFSKLVDYEIGQTISSIYADLFDSNSKLDDKIVRNKSRPPVKDDGYYDDDFDGFESPSRSKNQTTLQLLRNLINLPSMISNVMYKLIDQNLNSRNAPKITFHNQDIETILKTNLSNLQALKTKYLSTLREHVENLNLDSKTKTRQQQQNLHTIAQPFFELIESQLRETLETKIDGLINSMSALNSQISKLKPTNEQEEDQKESEMAGSEKQGSELVADIDHEIEQSEHSVDNEDLLPENDEIVDEYTQTLRSQRVKRQVPCNRGQELDEYVDSLFRFASRLIRAMEPVSIPNATIDLPEYNMKLFIHHCGATRAHTLQRKRPAWVYCTNESVSLGLTVGFEDVRVKCKYRAIKDVSRFKICFNFY